MTNREKHGAGRGHAGGEVAIIGMACRFARAAELAAYWANIVDGVDCVSEVPPERWEVARYLAEGGDGDGTYSRWGGFLDTEFDFDPIQYGIPPKVIAGADPQQFLMLQCVHDALSDADHLGGRLDGLSSEVLIGCAANDGPGTAALAQRVVTSRQVVDIVARLRPDLGSDELEALRDELTAALPEFAPDTVPGVVPNVLAGRIANRFDSLNANFILDAACASSLIVTELGVRNLLSGSSDLSIVGAVHANLNATLMTVFSTLGAFSRDGRCRPFDRNSSGTVAGEGVGALVLKRVDDAVADGDRVYAVIEGTGSSSDGRSTAVLAPSRKGEALAIRRAQAMSGGERDSIELIEAHGTGTVLGDRTELEVLAEVFADRAASARPIAVGSAKSMVGHTLAAAGMAGLIKTALALHQRVLPATLHCDDPHDLLSENRSTLYANVESKPWIRPAELGPRRAGVSAFGFGGVNAHVVLREHDDEAGARPSLYRRWSNELCVLEADSQSGLEARARDLRRYLDAAPDMSLRDLAYTLHLERQGREKRMAIVAGDVGDLARVLDDAIAHWARRGAGGSRTIDDRKGVHFFERPYGEEGGRLALMFPGEGSAYPGMLRDYCMHFPAVHRSFERADWGRMAMGRGRLSDHVFSPGGESSADLSEVTVSSPLAFTANLALYGLLADLGVAPDVACGHSAGELTALVAGGVVSVDDFHSVVAALGRGVEEDLATVTPSAMLAVGCDAATISEALADIGCPFDLANDNCPHQVVIVVEPAREDEVVRQCRSRRLVVQRLPFRWGYHTPHYRPMCSRLERALAAVPVNPARIPVYSFATGRTYPDDAVGIVELASSSSARPVRFSDMISRMYDDGARIFLETGAGSTLRGFVADILRGREHCTLSLDSSRAGLAGLQRVLAQLVAHHVDVDLSALYARRGAEALSLDLEDVAGSSRSGRPAKTRISLSTPEIGLPAEKWGSVPAVGQMPAVARDGTRAGDAPGAATAAPSAVVRGYFGTMAAVVKAQEEVMLAYLGANASRATADAASSRDGEGPRLLGAAALDVEEPAARAVPAPEPPANEPRDIRARVFDVVSELTGYPAGSLQMEQELDADLGIDSLKQVAILAELEAKSVLGDGAVEEAQSSELRTLGQVVEFVSAWRGPPELSAGDGGAGEPGAFTVVGRSEGRLVVRRRVTPATDRYLDDHRFFGQENSETGTGCRPLAYMPMAMIVECMVGAASLLARGRRLAGVSDVRIGQWFKVPEDAGLEIELECVREARSTVQVVARPVGMSLASQGEAARCTARFEEVAESTPRAVARQAVGRDGPKEGDVIDGAWIYARRIIDNGPMFQGVVSIEQIGDDGLVGVVQALPKDGLFSDRGAGDLLIDPLIVDSATQLAGIWALLRCTDRKVTYPAKAAEMSFYGDVAKAGSLFRCEVRVHANRWAVVADIHVFDSHGTPYLRIGGLESVRWDWSDAVLEGLRFPKEHIISREVDVAGLANDRGAPVCVWNVWNQARATTVQDALARYFLNEEELAIGGTIDDERARTDWIYSQLALKDAVRLWALRVHGIKMYPADVPIERTGDSGPWFADRWSVGEPARYHLDAAASDRVYAAALAPYRVGVALGPSKSLPRPDESASAAARSTSVAGERLVESLVGEAVTRAIALGSAEFTLEGTGPSREDGSLLFAVRRPEGGAPIATALCVDVGGMRLAVAMEGVDGGDCVLDG